MYFVTICTKDKEYFFGDVKNGEMVLNDVGKMVNKYWREIPAHFLFVKLDEFVVMPNHVHGIVEISHDEINNDCGGVDGVETQHCCVSTVPPLNTKTSNTFYKLKPGSLPVIIRSFKSIVAKNCKKQFLNIGFAWQPRYYDQIIRNEISLNKIREYIQINPQMWERDRNKTENIFM
ncbi:MAG: transposase [Parcubacteria group bacterium]